MSRAESSGTISSDKLASLTGLTDRRHRQLAKEGYFPNPDGGQYQLVATLRGLFKHFQEQIHKKNDSAKQAEARLKTAKADMAEEELAEFRKQYVEKKEIGPALRNISLHQRAVLQRKLENELSPKMSGCKPAEILAMHKAAVDEICAIFQEGTRQWLEDPPDPSAPCDSSRGNEPLTSENPKGVSSLSPGLRRSVSRAATLGKPRKNPPNPEGVAS